MTTPALPPGFVLDEPQASGGAPPLPPGFVMEQAQPSAPRAAAPAAADPSEGGSTLQFATPWKTYDTGIGIGQGTSRFLAGVGSAIEGTAEGIGQLTGLVSQEQVDDRRRTDAPLMATGAGLAGNITGQAIQMAAPIPAGAALKATSWAGKAAPYVGAAARSGAFTSVQGMGQGESRASEAGKGAAWGVAGQGVASGLSGLAKGAISRMEPTAAAIAKRADQLGFKLGIPQLSDNAMVRTVASQVDRMPFSGAGSRGKANQATFNREVGESFGAKGDKITPDVFAKAKTALSNKFEMLSSRNDLVPTTQLASELRAIQDEAVRLGGSDTARMVNGWTKELLSKADADGVIPGKAYQSFDSRLGKVLKSGGEPANYLGRLRDAVREAMDESITPRDAAAWKTIRQQWANLKTVEPLVAKATKGDIPPSQLMGRVTADNAGKARMATGGGGKLGELARIGQQYLKDAPNSGTADRLLVNAAVGSGLYGAQEGGLISPETAMKIGGGLLANRVVSKALGSKMLAMGESRTLSGLSRIGKPAPRLLPAGAAALGTPLELDIVGGDPNNPATRKRIRELQERAAGR